MALLELYQKRHGFVKLFAWSTRTRSDSQEAEKTDVKCGSAGVESEVGDNEHARCSIIQKGHISARKANEDVPKEHHDRSHEEEKLDDTEVLQQSVCSLEHGTFREQCVPHEEETSDAPLTTWGKVYTLLVGATSGFLGGLCGIRGPPVILYFLYPPVCFDKNEQRSTALCMSSTNAAMRAVYYVVDVFIRRQANYFSKSEWGLYLSIVICSLLGSFVGAELFEILKDSRETIRTVLAVLLLMCGVSLILSSFGPLET